MRKVLRMTLQEPLLHLFRISDLLDRFFITSIVLYRPPRSFFFFFFIVPTDHTL
jgi:hypothetical protein